MASATAEPAIWQDHGRARPAALNPPPRRILGLDERLPTLPRARPLPPDVRSRRPGVRHQASLGCASGPGFASKISSHYRGRGQDGRLVRWSARLPLCPDRKWHALTLSDDRRHRQSSHPARTTAELLGRDRVTESAGVAHRVASIRCTGQKPTVFPRFHQWHAVRSLTDHAATYGASRPIKVSDAPLPHPCPG